MNNGNNAFNPPVSPDGSTRSPEMVSDETTHTPNDDDDSDLIARDEDIFVPTTSTNNEETSIEIGLSQPLRVGDSPHLVANNLPLNNQPTELDAHHGQPTDEILYALSPTNLILAEDHLVPLSPDIRNATHHINIPYDNDLFNERETFAEPVQNEDDDIQVLFVETIPIQTVESPVPHEPINDQIHNILAGPIVEIDLTQDENENEEGPEMIDLTRDDDEQEEVCLVQLTSFTDHINENEQNNQPENAPSVLAVPITERLPPVTTSSSEAADHNPIISNVTDNAHQTIENIAHLQVLTSSSRTNKRSSSSDEIRRTDKKHIPGTVKRLRNSTP